MAITRSNNGAVRAMELAEYVAGELERQTTLIDRLLERTENALRRQTTRREIQPVDTADASGIAQWEIDIPPGEGWSLISFAGVASAAATGYGAIYLGEIAPQRIIAAFDTGIVFSDDFQVMEYVPSLSKIIVVLNGQTVGTDCYFNLRYQVEDE